MSHYFKELTPLSFLDRARRACPDDTAVITADTKLSYKTLWQRAIATSLLCRELGIGRGDNVTLLSVNCFDGIVCHFGIPASGGILVSLNPFLDDAILLKQVEACDSKVLFVHQQLLKDKAGLLAQLAGKVELVVLGEIGQEAAQHREFEQYYQSLTPERFTGIRLDDGVHSEMDAIVMNFTSGTTGKPKGVLFSHRAAYIHSYGQITMFELSRHSRYYWSLPMFHVNGWGHMWANVAVGARQFVALEQEAGLEQIIERHKIDRLAGSPRLLSGISFDLIPPDLRAGLQMMTGGASPSKELITNAELSNIKVIHQYGLNETCGPIIFAERRSEFADLAITDKVKMLRRQGVEAGHASGSTRVMDINTKKEVPWDGETIGEIVLTGNTVALGYFGMSTADKNNAFQAEGFYSGDLAVIHSNGDIELVDRKKDLIHVDTPYGWENISSSEIEQVILDLAKVKDCAVVGFNSEDKGAVVAACIESDHGALTEQEILTHCKGLLPFYKVPSRIVFIDLPKTATGKIQKEVLRQTLAAMTVAQAEPLAKSDRVSA